jgi:hypothetical protein
MRALACDADHQDVAGFARASVCNDRSGRLGLGNGL